MKTENTESKTIRVGKSSFFLRDSLLETSKLLKKERAYGFRQYLNTVHKADRFNSGVPSGKNEVIVNNGWKIVIPEKADGLHLTAGKDLQDYFFTSMNVSIPLVRSTKLGEFMKKGTKSIVLAERKDLPELGKGLSVSRSFILKCDEDMIVVCGFDERGVAQGGYYIEDLMNLREAPFLEKTDALKKEPLFSPRMTHSGWGIDQFPDGHLHAMAHAGFDAILVFVKAPDKTTMGYLDFNDLVERAAGFGLDVYFYSYLKSLIHPEDLGAEEFYDSSYGALFKNCPCAKGLILVGESCEFPSRDTVNTTGRLKDQSEEHGIQNLKPSPGWWPCYDYPQWLDMVKKSVRRYSPHADIVFWTYNWGWAPEKDRLKLIEALPTDVSLEVTYEMFEPLRKGKTVHPVMDYTISFPGPGKYFISEAKAAKKKNMRLYSMTNTGGMTWDFSVVPYIPVPFQWAKRFETIHQARKNWGLCGLMESHHYGWYPSPVSEAAKWSFWSNSPNIGMVLEKIAERDFSAKAAPYVIEAWKAWSNAMNDCIPSNEDQYGPFRVGPSYPMIFHPDITRRMRPKEIPFPTVKYAHHGGFIVKTFYHPYENAQQSPGPQRMATEIGSLKKMLAKWNDGISQLEKAISLTPEKKKAGALKMLGLGKFIRNTILTGLHMKQWWSLNQKLLNESNPGKALKLLESIEALAKKELANAQDTIPLVEADSRLGWEPSMEYVTDRWHIEWKIRQVRSVLESQIPAYRKIISLK